MTFYKDILAHPEEQQKLARDSNLDRDIQHQEDLSVIESVALRLRDGVYHPSRLTMALREHAQVPAHAETSEEGASPIYRRVVNRVEQILTEVERLNESITSIPSENSTAIPMLLLSMAEWGSVLRLTVRILGLLAHLVDIDMVSYTQGTLKPQRP